MQALKVTALVSTALALAACGGTNEHRVVREAAAATPTGTPYVVRDTTVTATQEATAIAEPFAQATVSTKLMGTVIAVLVKEGDRVAAGQPLVRIDARDLDAKRQQVQAGIASAEAMHHEAELMAARMRALYADSAAPKAQLDAAEAGLARARAGVSAARAGEAEIDAMSGYAVVRAPFAGMVTQRFVDRGAFAAPGAPLVTVQDNSSLRIAATVAPEVAAAVKRGATVMATVGRGGGHGAGGRCRPDCRREPVHHQRDREEPRGRTAGRRRVTSSGGDGARRCGWCRRRRCAARVTSRG